MELWTHSEEGTWKRWSHASVRLGLDALAGKGSRIDRVVVMGGDPVDDEQVLVTIGMIRRLAIGPARHHRRAVRRRANSS